MVFCCNDCFDSDTQDCLSCAVGTPTAGIQAAWGIELPYQEVWEKGEKGYKSDTEFVQDARGYRSEERCQEEMKQEEDFMVSGTKDT